MRLAICGLGAAARNIHIPAYRRLKDVVLVGGCDPDPHARTSVKDVFPLLYADLAEMLEQVRPDALAICTPPALHYEQTLLAIEKGCHVFAEKPLCESLEEVDRIIEAARRVDKRVVVNTQFPAMKIYREARRQIGTREFGRLLYLHAWQTFNPSERTEAGWRGELRKRVCFEFGIHVFELVRYFFDAEPVRMFAHMPSPPGVATCDVVNTIALEFSDGRGASIVLDRLSKGPDRYLEMRLDGEHASMHTSIGGSMELRIGIEPRRRRPFLRLELAGGGRAVIQTGERSRLIAREGLNPFATATAAQFREFQEEINGGAPARSSASEHKKTLALVLAAYQSAQTGVMIDLRQAHD